MKTTSFTYLAVLTLILAASSCNTQRQTSSSVSTTGQTSVVKKTTPKKHSTIYVDNEPVTSTPSSAVASVDPNVIAGEWTLYAVKGKMIKGENRPTVNFNIDDHRLYGNNGCNVINADFNVSGSNGLQITNMLSTMMACADAPYEQAVNEGLDQTRHFKVTTQGHEYLLELFNQQNRSLLTFRKHNMDFINGPWTVIEIEGTPVDNPDVQMVIDIPEQSIHGHTGCNILNGDLLIDPDKSHSIQFSNIGTTKMMCRDSSVETAFLVALEKIEYAHRGQDQTIIFSDKNDDPVIIMKKIVN